MLEPEAMAGVEQGPPTERGGAGRLVRPQKADPRPALIVCLSAGFGGADVRVLQVASGLHGRRDYAVATLAGSPLQRKLRDAGLNVIEMGASRADPGLLRRFIALLRNGRFQVVDAHNPQSQAWALPAARAAGLPVLVSTVHHVYAMSDGGPLKRHLYQNVLRLNRMLGCRFVTVSEEIARSLDRLGIGPCRGPRRGSRTRTRSTLHTRSPPTLCAARRAHHC
jgi:hypothetical protein